MSSTRIRALDVIRGFALCGITVANVKPIAHRGSVFESAGTVLGPPGDGVPWLHLLVDQRFYPIFAVLFGVGFELLLRSAAGARRVLVRRLLALLVIGLVHLTLLWPGDVLTAYALFGLVVLVPASWLPRAGAAVLCAVLIVAALGLGTGFHLLIPGLLLLGSVLARCGVVDRLEGAVRVPSLLLAGFVVLAAPFAWLQVAGEGYAYPIAGLLIAGAYGCGLLLLLGTPVRGVLTAALAPLGRMALTNYLATTVLVLAISLLVPGSDGWGTGTVLAIAGSVLVLEWGWSTLWLRWFRQGPLEWGWRWVTWWRRPPLRVDRAAGGGAARPSAGETVHGLVPGPGGRVERAR
ncbi:DUF418 domain-containing protein [Catenuloplanes atrovinosus]|uniref:Membrane protein YeiB n=1 Tax=Catenuloplanes atrovinosus TaxID=137266 RepID=A0AAE3YKW3_9ACTN|nr:DUF418 domain-containing protein [Catenuloplanes atrovinosus]MDR7274792.1 putative membrane protein YeiB [Catenuloplanes atrovinosus]